MTTLYLVRHGKAAAGYDAAHDPGLDEQGREQAQSAARILAPLGPLVILSSPLARARETAAPLAAMWNMEVRLEPGVGEIPSPSEDLDQRSAWLRQVMASTWPSMDAPVRQWRRRVIDTLAALDRDTVIFTHFIAINAAVSSAVGADEIVHFMPDNASITRMRAAAGGLELIEKGRQRSTLVG